MFKTVVFTHQGLKRLISKNTIISLGGKNDHNCEGEGTTIRTKLQKRWASFPTLVILNLFSVFTLCSTTQFLEPIFQYTQKSSTGKSLT